MAALFALGLVAACDSTSPDAPAQESSRPDMGAHYVYCGIDFGPRWPVVIEATAATPIHLSQGESFIAISDDCQQGAEMQVDPPEALTVLTYYPDQQHTVMVKVQVNQAEGQLSITPHSGAKPRIVSYTP